MFYSLVFTAGFRNVIFNTGLQYDFETGFAM